MERNYRFIFLIAITIIIVIVSYLIFHDPNSGFEGFGGGSFGGSGAGGSW